MHTVTTDTGLKFELGKIKMPRVSSDEEWLVYAKCNGLTAKRGFFLDFTTERDNSEFEYHCFVKQTHCMLDIMAKMVKK